MKNYLKIGAVVIALGAATLLAACEPKKKDDKAPAPPAKIEQVDRVAKENNAAISARLNALEKRVGSLEKSRTDVRAYLTQKEKELKAKGY